jgi:2-polyprenyl-3-methyl-5-hydroxy-6-metoxy-1,4-benzoquinol methylase
LFVTRPQAISEVSFDKIICPNVLGCVENRLTFINSFKKLLIHDGVCVLSHLNFDSAIYSIVNKPGDSPL